MFLKTQGSFTSDPTRLETRYGAARRCFHTVCIASLTALHCDARCRDAPWRTGSGVKEPTVLVYTRIASIFIDVTHRHTEPCRFLFVVFFFIFFSVSGSVSVVYTLSFWVHYKHINNSHVFMRAAAYRPIPGIHRGLCSKFHTIRTSILRRWVPVRHRHLYHSLQCAQMSHRQELERRPVTVMIL